MSLKNTATNQIKRFGKKGLVTLLNYSQTVDVDELSVENSISSRIKLLAHVTQVPSDKVETTNDRRTAYKILAAIDSDFNGDVSDQSKVEFLGKTLDVKNFVQRYVNSEIAYVEIYADG